MSPCPLISVFNDLVAWTIPYPWFSSASLSVWWLGVSPGVAPLMSLLLAIANLESKEKTLTNPLICSFPRMCLIPQATIWLVRQRWSPPNCGSGPQIPSTYLRQGTLSEGKGRPPSGDDVPGMAAHTCDLRRQSRESHESKTSLVYTVSLWPG